MSAGPGARAWEPVDGRRVPAGETTTTEITSPRESDGVNLAFELLALCLYGPLLVLMHEAGHALFARRGGYRVTSFGIGLGPPLWSVYLRDGVVLHFDRWLFAGGACTAIPLGPQTPQRAWFHAGGLLLQAALGLVLLVAPQGWLVDRVASFNLLVAVTNLVPWKLGAQASDGWHLLDSLTGGRRGGTVLGQRASLQRMRDREAAVDSPVGVAYCDVCLAWSEAQLGRAAAAAQRLEGRGADATRDPWVDALFHVATASTHRARGCPLPALRAVREGRGIDRLSDDARALLDLAEARGLIDVGAPEQAAPVLAKLAGASGQLATQAAAVLLLASLQLPTDELEVATWRVVRRVQEAWLDPLDTVLALRLAADELTERGRRPAAASARTAAAQLLATTVRGLPADEADEARRRVTSAAGDRPASPRGRQV